MFKVLIVEGDLGGTIQLQKDLHAKVAKDLEVKLNSSDVERVVSIAAHETEHQFKLIAVVEVAEVESQPTPEVEG